MTSSAAFSSAGAVAASTGSSAGARTVAAERPGDMPDKHAEGQVPESKQNAAPKMADFSDAFYKTRETSGMTEQNRADVNCVSQICIQIPDMRQDVVSIIVSECRCEEFEAQIAWSRILALAAATGTAKTPKAVECEASQSGAAKTAQRPDAGSSDKERE